MERAQHITPLAHPGRLLCIARLLMVLAAGGSYAVSGETEERRAEERGASLLETRDDGGMNFCIGETGFDPLRRQFLAFEGQAAGLGGIFR